MMDAHPPNSDNALPGPSQLNEEDSNGRDCVASQLGLSRGEFKLWLRSAAVQPHLRMWRRHCIDGSEHFRNGMKWIDTGYFYAADGLEIDLALLIIMGGSSDFHPEETDTSESGTMGRWLGCVEKIVGENEGEGMVLDGMKEKSGRYADEIVVEMLCLIFHSVAHRGPASVWLESIEKADGKDREETEDAKEKVRNAPNASMSTPLAQAPGRSSLPDNETPGKQTQMPTPETVRPKKILRGVGRVRAASSCRWVQKWMDGLPHFEAREPEDGSGGSDMSE